ncbi:hypothetical protein HC928_06250 [bacterium]|nr:hypothetical protein [bacterium]
MDGDFDKQYGILVRTLDSDTLKCSTFSQLTQCLHAFGVASAWTSRSGGWALVQDELRLLRAAVSLLHAMMLPELRGFHIQEARKQLEVFNDVQ